MEQANQFVHPIDYYGTYRTESWAGYVFKELLGYTSGYHTGVDYNGAGAGNADIGLPIRAIASGVVRYTGDRTDLNFGRVTIIEHPLSPSLRDELGCDSLFSRIMHQSEIDVSVDDKVVMGQVIGKVGNSGTTYAHCHIDLYKGSIEGGGVHFRYDKDTQLTSYLDVFEFIQSHLQPVDTATQTQLKPFQRLLENTDGVNQRDAPNTNSNIIKEWVYDAIPYDFRGYVHGQDPYGNGSDVWYVGAYSGGYFYSGAFTDKSTAGLNDLTPASTPPESIPAAPESPSPEASYVFGASFDFVTEVDPAANGNFEHSNFPEHPTGIVLHDFGTPGVDTFGSLKNTFTSEGTEVSAHFAVSKDIIGQFVDIIDRAYHAGSTGNVYWSIELDPASINDPVQIANARKIIAALQNREGRDLPLHKHSEFVATKCGDIIDLNDYVTPYGITTVPTTPSAPDAPVVDENTYYAKRNTQLIDVATDTIVSSYKAGDTVTIAKVVQYKGKDYGLTNYSPNLEDGRIVLFSDLTKSLSEIGDDPVDGDVKQGGVPVTPAEYQFTWIGKLIDWIINRIKEIFAKLKR